MKTNYKKLLLALLAIPVIALGATAAPAYAEDEASTPLSIGGGAGAAKGEDQTNCIFGNEPSAADPAKTCSADGDTPIFKTITNVLLFIIGAVSVIMLILGGFRYTISQGDSSALTSAKNTILYAIIGIVVAILAFGVVNFVIGSFVASPTE